MTTYVSSAVPFNPPSRLTPPNGSTYKAYAFVVKYYSGKHPTSGNKFKAICFSTMSQDFVQDKKALKNIIKDKKLAYITVDPSNRVVQIEMNQKWTKDLTKKGVTEIVHLNEGQYVLLMNDIDVLGLSDNNYSVLENAQKANLK